MEYNFNEFIGIETLSHEYKEFTFNQSGINLDNNQAFEYCKNNIFEFNDQVIDNLFKYIENNIKKYACGFHNSNIVGNFFIGINDYGFVKGIPYNGILPKDIIIYKIYDTLNEIIPFYDFRNNIEINFFKVRKPTRPKEKNHSKVREYIIEKNKYNKEYNNYLQRDKLWFNKLNYYNRKLVTLANDPISRQLLINYIEKFDKDCSVIKLLLTDYKMPYHDHRDILILKEEYDNPYYWITRWKDEMITIIRTQREQFNYDNAFNSIPINLLSNVSEMIPYWMNNNDNMNLYVIHIKFNKPKNNNNNKLSYYDNKNKYICCYRTILTNGDPVCLPYL